MLQWRAVSRAWLRVIPESEAEGELLALYDELYAPYPGEPRGQLDNILQVHSLDPGSLRAHLALYRNAMTGSATLPKVERELIGVVVSGLNGCLY